MTDLAVRAVMTADGSGLVTGAKQAQTALDNLRGSHDTLSVASKNLTTASRELRAANDETGLSTYRLTRAMSELGGPMGARVLGMRELLRGSHELIEGLGLLNTAGIALGISLLAAVGHTTLFRNALEGLEGTVSNAIGWFDRLVSGKERVDAAMAKDIIAKYRESGSADELIADLQKLDAFMADRERSNGHFEGRRSPSEIAEADRLGLQPKLPLISPYSQEYFQAQTARKALLDKMLPELDITPNRVTGGADNSNQRFWDSQFRNDAFLDAGNGRMAANNMVLDPATGQWVARQSSSNPFAPSAAQKWDAEQSANALKVIGPPQGIIGLDSSVVAGFDLRNGGGSKAAASQRVVDEKQTADEITKLWDDYYDNQAKKAQESLDMLQQRNIDAVDNIRDAFNKFGDNASVDFQHADREAVQFLQTLGKMAMQMYIMQPLSNALFGAQGTPGGGLIGGLAQSIFGVSGPAAAAPFSVAAPSTLTALETGILGFHGGGVVGSDAYMRRYIHPSYFDNAPRMHSGGIAGDEVPIVARKGEGVFTEPQMRALGANMGAPQVNVNVHNNSGGQARVQQSQDANGNLNLDIIVDQVQTKIADTMQRGSSPVSSAIENIYGVRRSPR